MSDERDKIEILNYRQAKVVGKHCRTCIHKQAVPWMWCEVIGRQACMGWVCDKWKGAIEERVKRTAKLAKDIPELKPYLANVSVEVNNRLDEGKKVLLEGTQGMELSLYHGSYPFVTSRDTSASAICSEAGVGPTRINDCIVVLKSFMTRVGTGPLPGEISKEEAIKRGWFETAAGTGRDRRAAPFNFEIARKSVTLNGATQIGLTKLDCVYPTCKAARNFSELSTDAKSFVEKVEKETKVPVKLIGTGPDALDIIDRRSK